MELVALLNRLSQDLFRDRDVHQELLLYRLSNRLLHRLLVELVLAISQILRELAPNFLNLSDRSLKARLSHFLGCLILAEAGHCAVSDLHQLLKNAFHCRGIKLGRQGDQDSDRVIGAQSLAHLREDCLGGGRVLSVNCVCELFDDQVERIDDFVRSFDASLLSYGRYTW